MDFNELAAHLAADNPAYSELCPYAVLNSVAADLTEGKLASGAVRLLCLGGLRGFKYSQAPELSPVDVRPEWSHGRRRLMLVTHVTRLAELLERPHVAALAYSKLLDGITAVGHASGTDVHAVLLQASADA